MRVFATGSSVEMPFYGAMIAIDHGVDFDMLDLDIMSYNTTNYAFSYSHRVSDMYCGDIVRVFTEDVHIGM